MTELGPSLRNCRWTEHNRRAGEKAPELTAQCSEHLCWNPLGGLTLCGLAPEFGDKLLELWVGAEVLQIVIF
jgi:hypothetical protein